MFAGAVVLAHQGGWDEALMVLVPLGLFATLVWVAIRRSRGDAHGSEHEAS